MPTINLVIADDNDDAQQSQDGSAFTRTANPMSVIEAALSSVRTSSGWRFTNAVIPDGATITNAVFSLYEDAAGSDAMTVDVYAEDADNSDDFLSTASVVSRTLTTATYAWSIPATSSAYNSTGSIASLIQEVIDRPGWSSGNAITIIVVPRMSVMTDTFTAASHESLNPSKYAKLAITYTESFPFSGGGSAAFDAGESEVVPERSDASYTSMVALMASRAVSTALMFGAELLRRRRRLSETSQEETTTQRNWVGAFLSSAIALPSFTLFRTRRPIEPQADDTTRQRVRTLSPLSSTSVSPPAFSLFTRTRSILGDTVDAVRRTVSMVFPWGTRTGLCTDGAPATATFMVSPRMPALATFVGSAIDESRVSLHGTAILTVSSPAAATLYIEGC